MTADASVNATATTTTSRTRPAAAARRTGMSPTQRDNLKWGLIFCSPAILGLLLFTLYPVIRSFQQSFTSSTMLTQGDFIGWSNYADLVGDTNFVSALGNTLYLLVWTVPLGIIVAMCLALLLNMNVAGRSIYRVIFFMPSIVPLVATAVVWYYVFNPQYGILNSLLALVGVTGPSWLADPEWAKPALIIVSTWGVGGLMVILLAGVQDVPTQLYEQARIDGANVVSRFRHVTLPFMSPHLLFALVTGLIAGFQYFTEVYVITSGSGSPAGSTMVAGLYLYQNAFAFFKVGYASAMAWVLFVISAGVAALVFRFVGRRVYYGGN